MATSGIETNSSEPQASSGPPLPLLAPLLVYPLFLASGAAGLIYEVVWNRMLLNLFGAGLYAVCAVLTAFMAGLALGSWLLGRASDRMRLPFRVYGVFEIGIGISGLLVGLLLDHAGHLEGWAYRHLSESPGLLTGWRFLFACGAMLVPTTLMGATLPILSRFLVRGKAHLGGHVSALYATNTFGAVCGTFLAGFVLIAAFGVWATLLVAVALNLLVGSSAIALSLWLERGHEMTPATPRPPRAARATTSWVTQNLQLTAVFFAAFVSGGAALAAQIVWTRSLVFVFEYLKNTTYAFSAMLTVFLIGLALGSAVVTLFIDRQSQPLRLYGALLFLMGVFVQCSLVFVQLADRATLGQPYDDATQTLNWGLAVLNVMTQSAWVMFFPTLLMGMAFPVAARVVTQIGHVGEDVGTLYAVNTLGAIFGASLATFLLIPNLGLSGSLVALGVTYSLLGFLVLLSEPKSKRLAIVALVLTGLTTYAVHIGVPHGKDGKPLPLQPMTTSLDSIPFYKEDSLATVAVVEMNTQYRTIYVDGVGVAGTDPVLQTDQKSLAHVPMMLIDDPKSALTVGFGSGGCSYSLLQHSKLDFIRCVEICKTMPMAAPALTDANHAFYDKLDPRYQIIFDDARSYLRYTPQKYSFISTDCTDLRYKSNANLYDIEYFEACRARLTDDGMVIVWMPLAGLSKDMFQCALRTFNKVFPDMGVFFMDNAPTHYVLLAGWQHGIKIDYGRIVERLKEPKVKADLAELNLDDAAKLVSCFITGGAPLTKWLNDSGTDVNTENRPILEFTSPKYGYGDRPLIDNLDELMKIHVSPTKFIVPGTATPEDLKKIARYERALPWIIKGHDAYRRTDLEEATRYYLKALAFAPEDNSLRNDLLRFTLLTRRIELEPNNPEVKKLLGRVYMLQADKQEDALSLLQRAEAQQRAALKGADPERQKLIAHEIGETLRWIEEIKKKLKSQGADAVD